MTFIVELITDKPHFNRRLEVHNFNDAMVEFKKLVEIHWVHSRVNLTISTRKYFPDDTVDDTIIYSLVKHEYVIKNEDI